MNLGDYVQLEPEVVTGMASIANMNINTKFMFVGCGEGQFLEKAIDLGVKPENVFGVELDTTLANVAIGKGLNVVNDDAFNLDYSGYDVVMFWFNLSDNLTLFFDKLYNEMKNNKKVVCMYSSRQQWRDGVYVPEESYPKIPHVWQPSDFNEVLGNRFYVYIR